ncbi:MAG: nucleotidyltransferase domain-containing protein [Clostridiales bacterium]|nr:nucleotidyltransferase domain-containing protein [Clostridiales bacterium]
MKINVPERVLRKISEYAKEADVQRVILFGSRARGTHTPRSDVDLAVAGGDFDSFYWSIKEKTPSLLTFDIVSLDGIVSTDLLKEIERDGVTVYEKAE